MRPPKSGDIVCYHYLWSSRDYGKPFGRTPSHSDKLRPALVMHREPLGAGLFQIMMLAISTKKQREPDKALAVPQQERLRVGLHAKSWIVVSGMNVGTWPSELFTPFSPPSDADGPYARFSADFFSHIAKTVATNLADVEAEQLRKQKRLKRSA